MPTDTTDDVPEVELLETSRFETSEQLSNEPIARAPIIGGKALAVLALAAIVAGLVLIPRTAPQVVLEPVPSQTTAPTSPTTSIPDEANGAVSRQQARTTVTQAIPLFDDGITPEIPGVLSGVDVDGSLIVIDRSQIRPDETRLAMTAAAGDPRSTLIIGGTKRVAVEQQLSAQGRRIVVDHDDDRFLDPSFPLDKIVPDLTGTAVLVSHEADVQIALAVPLNWDGIDSASLLEWTIPGQGVEVLGLWGNRLLVHRANRIWLLDTDLESSLVGDGRFLAYDGAHLSRLVCDRPTNCSLVVGTPDDPALHVLPLPSLLAELSPDDWAGSISVSSDGRRLAASVRFGVVWLPFVVDLVTGETQSLADGMNRQAPVAWSPDGGWLAYVFTDDVMVWKLDEQRSWRIQLNRQLETLLWR